MWHSVCQKHGIRRSHVVENWTVVPVKNCNTLSRGPRHHFFWFSEGFFFHSGTSRPAAETHFVHIHSATANSSQPTAAELLLHNNLRTLGHNPPLITSQTKPGTTNNHKLGCYDNDEEEAAASAAPGGPSSSLLPAGRPAGHSSGLPLFHCADGRCVRPVCRVRHRAPIQSCRTIAGCNGRLRQCRIPTVLLREQHRFRLLLRVLLRLERAVLVGEPISVRPSKDQAADSYSGHRRLHKRVRLAVRSHSGSKRDIDLEVLQPEQHLLLYDQATFEFHDDMSVRSDRLQPGRAQHLPPHRLHQLSVGCLCR